MNNGTGRGGRWPVVALVVSVAVAGGIVLAGPALAAAPGTSEDDGDAVLGPMHATVTLDVTAAGEIATVDIVLAVDRARYDLLRSNAAALGADSVADAIATRELTTARFAAPVRAADRETGDGYEVAVTFETVDTGNWSGVAVTQDNATVTLNVTDPWDGTSGDGLATVTVVADMPGPTTAPNATTVENETATWTLENGSPEHLQATATLEPDDTAPTDTSPSSEDGLGPSPLGWGIVTVLAVAVAVIGLSRRE